MVAEEKTCIYFATNSKSQHIAGKFKTHIKVKHSVTLKYFTAYSIPDICHKYHKLDMWRKICHVEKFQI